MSNESYNFKTCLFSNPNIEFLFQTCRNLSFTKDSYSNGTRASSSAQKALFSVPQSSGHNGDMDLNSLNLSPYFGNNQVLGSTGLHERHGIFFSENEEINSVERLHLDDPNQGRH